MRMRAVCLRVEAAAMIITLRLLTIKITDIDNRLHLPSSEKCNIQNTPELLLSAFNKDSLSKEACAVYTVYFR